MANDAVALLLIGGLGTRYGTVPPKQFQVFEGKPLFLHVAQTLSESVKKIVYVCHPSYLETAKEQLLDANLLRDEDVIIPGGKSRQESVRNGLDYLKGKASDESIVIINDGNRPHITKKMIEGVVSKAKENGAAVVAYRSSDSILMSKDGYSVDNYVDRDEVYIVQTPQAFRFGIILEAINKASKDYTDDGSLVMDVMGIKPLIEEGSLNNIKVTTK